MKSVFVLLVALLTLAGCGSEPPQSSNGSAESLPPVGQPLADDSVIRGRAEFQVSASNDTAFHKFIKELLPYAYAATGGYTVTYTNAAAVSFTINVAAFAAAGFSGDILSLGHVDLASLDDNSLKVCGVGGNQKCVKGIIRVYTTGLVSGFVNTDDGSYGAPVYAGSLNPTTAVGLNSAGAAQVQVVNIANNKNRLRLSDFSSPQYNVNADFANAGSGNYSMNFVVEYILSL